MGGGDDIGEYILLSGTTDKVLINNDKLLQSNGDAILLSPGTCQDLLLLSNTTDNVLLSGTSDRVLISGNCTSNVLLSHRRLRKHG